MILLQKESRCSSRSGSICVSVRDALGAFDFLDTEVTEEGGETNPYVFILCISLYAYCIIKTALCLFCVSKNYIFF